MVVEIKLFGSLKRFSPTGKVSLTLPESYSVDQLRSALLVELKKQGPLQSIEAIVERSAFATSESVISDTTAPLAERTLSLLPPVCGG